MSEENQILKQIALGDIRRNPLNPRKDFKGPHFDELVESIRQNGIITPILVRPIEDDACKYEIVYGERRYRAMCRIAADENGGIVTLGDILAQVRELDEPTAFDIMTIENLQRNDLTELEEAESFHLYVERHGEDAVDGLAERIGCSAKYIRRRIMVMRLPKYIRKAWGDRVIKFGHLEILAKITGDASAVKNTYDQLINSANTYSRMWTVGQFRTEIESASPKLDIALFDDADCIKCFNNSSVQKSLFDLGSEDVRCTRPSCFRDKQTKWLTDNWKDHRKKLKVGTNGFRFNGLTDYESDWHHCPARITAECKKCECYVTLLQTDGQSYYDRVCIGDEDCIKRQNKADKNGGSGAGSSAGSGESGSSGSGGNNSARVAWHGQHFRQKFYAEQLPIQAERFDPTDTEMLHLYLYLLISNIEGMRDWLSERLEIKATSFFPSPREIFAAIEVLSAEEVVKLTKDAAIHALIKDVEQESQSEYAVAGNASRQLFADHLGVDLAGQWAMTEEYISKKTKDELLNQGETLGIFAEEAVTRYVTEELQKDPEKIRSFKKGEIAQVIMKSGVDLVGLVPAEVLNVKGEIR